MVGNIAASVKLNQKAILCRVESSNNRGDSLFISLKSGFCLFPFFITKSTAYFLLGIKHSNTNVASNVLHLKLNSQFSYIINGYHSNGKYSPEFRLRSHSPAKIYLQPRITRRTAPIASRYTLLELQTS